jgi:hypothetical protein
MANPSGNGLLIIERILRDRDGIWRQINEERDLTGLVGQMLASCAISLAFYGAVLGASNSWQQALSSSVKLPLLFLATLAICLPTLYLFNLVFGARLSVMQAVALIMVSITVTAVLTLAFAPISLFFHITNQSYDFFKLLNIGILFLTAVVGLRFLTRGMVALNQHQAELAAAEAAKVVLDKVDGADGGQPAMAVVGSVPAGVGPVPPGAVTAMHAPHPHAPQPHARFAAVGPVQPSPGFPARHPGGFPAQRTTSMSLLYIWIALFGFVGTQLAYTLRPFFGDPDKPFALFREIDGTFYADLVRTIGSILTG